MSGGEFLSIPTASDGEPCVASVLPKSAVRSVLWVAGSVNRMLGYVREKHRESADALRREQ